MKYAMTSAVLLAASLAVSSVAAAAAPTGTGISTSFAAIPAVSDDAIAAQASNRLFYQAHFPSGEVTVSVVNGVVYLHGLVDTPLDEQRAEDVVSSIPGVAEVENDMAVNN
jgi:osmotically-inducible protein OsmY